MNLFFFFIIKWFIDVIDIIKEEDLIHMQHIEESIENIKYN